MYPGPVGQQTLFANYIISTRGVFFKTRGTDQDKKSLSEKGTVTSTSEFKFCKKKILYKFPICSYGRGGRIFASA